MITAKESGHPMQEGFARIAKLSQTIHGKKPEAKITYLINARNPVASCFQPIENINPRNANTEVQEININTLKKSFPIPFMDVRHAAPGGPYSTQR